MSGRRRGDEGNPPVAGCHALGGRDADGGVSALDRYEITGPIDVRHVLVAGRQVPFLQAIPANGGVIHLILDERYALDVSVADAEAFIPWIADAIAVAMGYNCHPRAGTEPARSDPFTPVHMIDWVATEEGPGRSVG